MVTIDMRNDATLMESRRKSRLGVAKEPDCLGAFNGNDAIWFVLVDMDLFSTVTKGIDGMSLALFTEMTPPPNTAGGA